MQNKLRSSLQNFILPGSFLRLFAFVGTSTQYYIQNLQINCVQVGGWHCSTACKLNLSRCRRCFLLPRLVHPDSVPLYTSGHHPAHLDRDQASATPQTTYVLKSLSLLLQLAGFFFFPQKKLFLCGACSAPEPQLSHFLNLSSLQTNSVFPKRFMVLCEAFAEPFLSLS